MDLRSIDAGLQIAATQGLTLNLQERTSLELALSTLKKTEQSVNDPFFWGKLLGQEDDYYVAYFTEPAATVCPQKKFFYSTKAFKFRPLPALTANEAKKFDTIRTVTLTGNPTWAADTNEEDGDGADPNSEVLNEADSDKEADAEPRDQRLTELHMLSGLVARIDDGTAVVPRGAYTVQNDHTLIPSPEFKGLVYSNAQELSSWVHFRPAENLETLRRLAANDYQFHADAFESLQDDVPRGSWVFRHDPISGTVTLRSLMWPGYVAYCVLNTTTFGSVYIGSGEQNVDLPFLLL